MIFMEDLASRLANRVQPTSDGHKAYLEAVEGARSAATSTNAMLVKLYGLSGEGEKRYSTAECIGAVKHRIQGTPDPNVLCGEVEFERADAHSPLYPAHKCILKEDRKPHAFRRAVRDVLQFRSHP